MIDPDALEVGAVVRFRTRLRGGCAPVVAIEDGVIAFGAHGMVLATVRIADLLELRRAVVADELRALVARVESQ